MSAGNPHTSYSDVTSAESSTCPSKIFEALAGWSHRQRQNLLVEFTDSFGPPDRNSEQIGRKLTDACAAFGGHLAQSDIHGCVGADLDLLPLTFVRLGHAPDPYAERLTYLVPTRAHPVSPFTTATVRVVIDSLELEAAIAAVYAARLPIPAWWPAEARSAYIEEYASEAAGIVLSELDSIGDRVSDWAARSQVSGADKTTVIASAQQVLLDEACSEVQYDLNELIASKSAELMAEAVFDHGPPLRAAPRGVAGQH